MPPTPETDDSNKAGTGAPSAATTQTPPTQEPPITPESVQVPDGYKLVKEEDFNNVITQRQKNANKASEAMKLAQENAAVVDAFLQRNAVSEFLATEDAKEQYPDVTLDDILEGNPQNDEQIVKIAKAKQERFSKMINQRLANVQVAKPPVISAADRDTQLKELSGPNKPKNAFQRGLQLIRAQVKH